MKKKKLSGKLSLNKESISKLSTEKMSEIKGGGGSLLFTQGKICNDNFYTSRGIDCE